MADQPVNAGLNIKTLLSSDVLYVARLSTGEDCYIKANDLITFLTSGTTATKVICPFNLTTSILLASADMITSGSIKSVVLDCFFERNNKARKEIVQIFFENGTASLIEGPTGTIPDSEIDLGITLSVDSSSGLNLDITLDAVTANCTFFYNILSILTT
jgi:hypothetical protein